MKFECKELKEILELSKGTKLLLLFVICSVAGVCAGATEASWQHGFLCALAIGLTIVYFYGLVAVFVAPFLVGGEVNTN